MRPLPLLLVVTPVLLGGCATPARPVAPTPPTAATFTPTSADRIHVETARTQIKSLKMALQLYVVDNGKAPATQQGLAALLTEPTISPRPQNWKGPYFTDTETIPKDPWGNAFVYQSPGPEGADFLITSHGADGKPGGEGVAADIDSLQRTTSQTSP